jgi:hypothetical protein
MQQRLFMLGRSLVAVLGHGEWAHHKTVSKIADPDAAPALLLLQVMPSAYLLMRCSAAHQAHAPIETTHK